MEYIIDSKQIKQKKYTKTSNAKIANGYRYLPSLETQENSIEMDSFKKLGWVVPNEDYVRDEENDEIIENNLNKSKFSK